MGGEKLKTHITIFRAALLAVTLILLSVPLYAQSEDQGFSPNPVLPEESFILGEGLPQETIGGEASIWIILRMVMVLALAALAIYGVVFFIKRLARPPQSRDPHLKILASVPLGGDSFAAVISVGTKAWLVGGGSGAGVSLISEIEEQEALETMLLDESQKRAESMTHRITDFRSFLHRLSEGRHQEKGLNTHTLSLQKQRERLRGLGT